MWLLYRVFHRYSRRRLRLVQKVPRIKNWNFLEKKIFQICSIHIKSSWLKSLTVIPDVTIQRASIVDGANRFHSRILFFEAFQWYSTHGHAKFECFWPSCIIFLTKLEYEPANRFSVAVYRQHSFKDQISTCNLSQNEKTRFRIFYINLTHNLMQNSKMN